MSFGDIFRPDSKFALRFFPFAPLLEGFQSATTPCRSSSKLQEPGVVVFFFLFFFLISRSSEGGFFKEITSHFTSQAEQKLLSGRGLLLTACGRSWQHCWTPGSSGRPGARHSRSGDGVRAGQGGAVSLPQTVFLFFFPSSSPM